MQNYFATFDFKHVPGITVEQRQETEEGYYTSYIPPASNTSTSLGNSAPWNRNKSKNSKHTLAGTAVLTDSEGQYGSTAFLMDLSGANSTMDMDVTANKSWFMLGDKIIALGSNITSTKGREVDTSVDSRRLPVDGEHTLIWNGEDAGTFGEKTTTENSWAYIGYDVDGATAQVGYYFPNAGTQISFGGQDHTGSWYDNNRLSWYTGDSKEEITEPYADLFIHHGVNPVSGTYEYVILPNKTQEETAAYAAAKDYTVVALTDTLHAVYDHTLHVLAINNFADEAVSVTSPGSGVSYTVSRAAIVIIREGDDGAVQVAIQDPTGGTEDIVVSAKGVVLEQDSKPETDSCVSVRESGAGVAVTVSGLPAPEGKKFNTWNASFVLGEADPDRVYVTGLENPGVNASIGIADIMVEVDGGTETFVPKLALFPKESTWKLYSDSLFQNEITDKKMTLEEGANVAFVKVFTPDGALGGIYVLSVERTASGEVWESVVPQPVPGQTDPLPWNLVKGPYASNLHDQFGAYDQRFVVLEFDMEVEALPGKSGLLMAIQGEGGAEPSETESALTSFASVIVRTTPSGADAKIDLFSGTWVGGVTVPVGQPYTLKVVIDRVSQQYKAYVDCGNGLQDVYPSAWAKFRNSAVLTDISRIYLGGGDTDAENGKIVINAQRAGQTDGAVNIPVYAMDTDGNPVEGLDYQGEGILYGTHTAGIGSATTVEAPAAPDGYRLVGDNTVSIGSVRTGTVVVFRYARSEEIPTAPTNSVTVNDTVNGTVTVNKTTATMGSTVVITATPSEGYVLDSLKVTDAKGAEVSVKMLEEGKYAFTMPGSKATVTAVFTATSGETGTGFTDVPSNAWYAEAVQYVTEQSLMNGTSETAFSPMLSMSRSMLVTVLYRLAGEPDAGECAFTDVASGTWYTDAVAWAAANGIVTGTTTTTFAPDAAVTRESLAVILYRYAEMKEQAQGEKGDLTAFADGTSVSDWAAEAMAWAVGEGILTGKSGNTLDPQGTATRAEVATILMRFCSMTEK